ncbi:hypothetical protein RYX36_028770, partial [Vicia faba]
MSRVSKPNAAPFYALNILHSLTHFNHERDTISLPEASSLVRRSRQCSGDSSPDEKPLDDVKSHVLANVGSLPSSANIPASNQLLALLLKIIKTKQSKKNYPSSSLYNRK